MNYYRIGGILCVVRWFLYAAVIIGITYTKYAVDTVIKNAKVLDNSYIAARHSSGNQYVDIGWLLFCEASFFSDDFWSDCEPVICRLKPSLWYFTPNANINYTSLMVNQSLKCDRLTYAFLFNLFELRVSYENTKYLYNILCWNSL